MNINYISVRIDEDVDIDLSDLNLSDLFDTIEDDELKEEAIIRGIIAKDRTIKNIEFDDIKILLCDKFSINHLSEWDEIIKLLTKEMTT